LFVFVGCFLFGQFVIVVFIVGQFVIVVFNKATENKKMWIVDFFVIFYKKQLKMQIGRSD
jgi:hypothetical protein